MGHVPGVNLVLVLLIGLSTLLFPARAEASPITFLDATLWLAHAQVGQLPQCFDLRVEARVNGTLVATAESFPNVPFCVQYYGRIEYVRLPFVTLPGAGVLPGSVVEITPLARSAISRVQSSGSLRLYYNGWYPLSQSDSYVRANFGGGLATYHLLAGSQLSLLPPSGPPLSTTQYQILKPSYSSLGTWGLIAP